MSKVAKYNEETNVIDIVDLDAQSVNIEQNYERQKDALGVDDITIKDILNKPEDQRTEEDLMKLVLRNNLKIEHDKELERYKDYHEFVEIKDIEIPYGYMPHPVYSNEDGKVVCRYEPYIDYYFVRKDGQLVVNQTYYAWETNGLSVEMNYTFDENGRIVG